jgi:hypothetical protein
MLRGPPTGARRGRLTSIDWVVMGSFASGLTSCNIASESRPYAEARHAGLPARRPSAGFAEGFG